MKRLVWFSVLLMMAIAAPASVVRAADIRTIYSVAGSVDGATPSTALVDVGGTLYGTTTYGGKYGLGTVYSIDPTTGVETVLHSFKSGPAGVAPTGGDGYYPNCTLVKVAGILFGTTSSGGSYGNGTVFRINPSNTVEKVVYSFNNVNDGASPNSLVDAGGTLFGTTAYGGTLGGGTVFTVDPNTGAEEVIYSFQNGSDGTQPTSLIAVTTAGGLYDFYGTTAYGGNPEGTGNGTIFYLCHCGSEKVVYSFLGGNDGATPKAAMIDVGGTLYGTTSAGGSSNGGTMFSFNLADSSEETIYSFGTTGDGTNPQAPLTYKAGALYGTTVYGGSNGAGSVFEFNLSKHIEGVVFSFTYGSGGSNPTGGLTNVDGVVYGTASESGSPIGGAIFEIENGVEVTLYDFSSSLFSYNYLTPYQGNVLLVAGYGGSKGLGQIVGLNLQTHASTDIYEFSGGATDGSRPAAALISLDNMVYGTTENGGASNLGTLFSLDPASGFVTTIHSFGNSASDGIFPAASLLAFQNELWGTTESGGINGGGTVYKIDPTSGTETVVYSFPIIDGVYASGLEAPLIDVAGALFSTTEDGGSSGYGSVFRIAPHSGIETTLYSFGGGPDGEALVSGLINVQGLLYGTTYNNGGTIFSINPKTGAKTTVYTFDIATDGCGTNASLIYAHGLLYGMNYACGPNYLGTIFAFDPQTGAITIIHSFTGPEGAYPTGALIDIGGRLYGATSEGGAYGKGTVFEVLP